MLWTVGAINMSANRILTANGPLTIASAIGGAFSLSTAGIGTITLINAAANTYSGGTSVGAGSTLSVGSGAGVGSLGSGAVTVAGTLLFNRSDIVTVAGVISGAGSIVQQGSGTTVLTGVNTFTTPVTLAGGKLSVATIGAGTASSNLGAATSISFTGGTLQYTGVSASTDRGFSIAPGTNANFEVVTFGAVLTDSGATTVTTGGINKLGAGNFLFAGTMNNLGPTTVSAGVLQFARPTSLYNGNTLFWNENFLIVNSGGTLSLNVGGAGEFSASDVATLSALGNATGGLLSGSAIGFDTTNAGGTFTQTQVIADTNGGANSVGLGKYGTGTLVLNLANTYTGTTTVGAGTLVTTDPSNLGTGGGDIVIGSGATLDLEYSTNRNISLAGTLTNTSAPIVLGGNVTLFGNNATIGGAADQTFNGTISGAFNLTKAGADTVLLNSANTYGPNATTTILGGTVRIGVANALPATTAVNIGNNTSATVTLDLQSFNQTLGGLTIASGTSSGTVTSKPVLVERHAPGQRLDVFRNDRNRHRPRVVHRRRHAHHERSDVPGRRRHSQQRQQRHGTRRSDGPLRRQHHGDHNPGGRQRQRHQPRDGGQRSFAGGRRRNRILQHADGVRAVGGRRDRLFDKVAADAP